MTTNRRRVALKGGVSIIVDGSRASDLALDASATPLSSATKHVVQPEVMLLLKLAGRDQCARNCGAIIGRISW